MALLTAVRVCFAVRVAESVPEDSYAALQEDVTRVLPVALYAQPNLSTLDVLVADCDRARGRPLAASKRPLLRRGVYSLIKTLAVKLNGVTPIALLHYLPI